jgi:indole-3-glycerol phosphate synthase
MQMSKTDFLTRILEQKRSEIQEAKKRAPENELRDLAESPRDKRPFLQSLSVPGPCGVNIISEIKRASPSRGPIREDLDAGAHARAYEKGGASALSVLTEQEFFRGSPKDLKQARSAVSLPVLRKDFLISSYQIYESAVMGADAVLFIVRALPREVLRDFLELCGQLSLDALVEVHSEEELEDASWAGARLVGINNRDLKTFQTDIANCIRIGRCLEPRQVAVAESGIGGRSDIERIRDAGIWNFLIGESLVKAENPESFLQHLLGQE